MDRIGIGLTTILYQYFIREEKVQEVYGWRKNPDSAVEAARVQINNGQDYDLLIMIRLTILWILILWFYVI